MIGLYIFSVPRQFDNRGLAVIQIFFKIWAAQGVKMWILSGIYILGSTFEIRLPLADDSCLKP